MGWKMKTFVIFAVILFVVTTAWLGFVVYARYQANDYSVEVAAAFNAATLVNGEETFTDPDRAVISSYQRQRYVIIPENYKAIVSLLRKDCCIWRRNCVMISARSRSPSSRAMLTVISTR